MPEDTQVVETEASENPDGLDPLREAVQAARDHLVEVRAARSRTAEENEKLETEKALKRELESLVAEIKYEEMANDLTKRAGSEASQPEEKAEEVAEESTTPPVPAWSAPKPTVPTDTDENQE